VRRALLGHLAEKVAKADENVNRILLSPFVTDELVDRIRQKRLCRPQPLLIGPRMPILEFRIEK